MLIMPNIVYQPHVMPPTCRHDNDEPAAAATYATLDAAMATDAASRRASGGKKRAFTLRYARYALYY